MPYRAFPNACSPGEAGQALTPASQLGSQTRDNDSYAWTGHAETDRAYAVNGLNQYTTAGTATFTYDANGNLTADGTTTYVYDAENRLVSATTGGVTATLTWDPMGRLWQLVKGSANTRFLYDGDGLVVEYASTGAVTNRYVHGSNAAADDPLVWYQGAGITNERWLHADHQGSIVAISSTSGGSPTINSYDEYGIPAATNQGRFQYTGQAWLSELGLYHYKARFYSPTLGRFLQTDPIGYDDQVNLYAYVANDPVNATDPTGQFEQSGFAGEEATRGNLNGKKCEPGSIRCRMPQVSTGNDQTFAEKGEEAGAVVGAVLGAAAGGTAGGTGGALVGAACGPGAVVCSPTAGTAGAIAGGLQGAVVGGVAGAEIGRAFGSLVDQGMLLFNKMKGGGDGGRPGSNVAQNRQFRDVANRERLTPQQRGDLRRAVELESRHLGRELGYHDIQQIAREIKSGSY